MVKGFKTALEKETDVNTDFRKVLYTSKHLQLVLMSLEVGEEIGEEIHLENDQFFRFESGIGHCSVNETEYSVKDGDVLIVPAGAKHNILNASSTDQLKLYTIYAPPHHKDGIVRHSKQDATERETLFNGETTE
jgi:mannose-6-phosphate isomerase-like protein (cupin superfamily)